MSELFEHQPEIDYLAKDYASFRRLMLDQLSLLAPEWQEGSPADLGHSLVELLAYAADYLSYHQDAVATEAYLGTARLRRSIKRHARLLDYHLHEGCNARAWIHVEVSNTDAIFIPRGTRFVTHGADNPSQFVLAPEELNQHLLRHPASVVFESLHDARVRPEHNHFLFHTRGGLHDRYLRRGATRALLEGHAGLGLAPGDVLVFEQIIDEVTGLSGGVDPRRRHAVRLTEARPVSPQGPWLIAWPSVDALPFDLHIAPFEGQNDLPPDSAAKFGASRPPVSVARGNIILADHGQTIADEHLPQVRPRERYRPYLRFSDLTYAVPYEHHLARQQPAQATLAQLPYQARAAIELYEEVAQAEESADESLHLDRRRWTLQRELISSGQFDRHFVVEMEGTGRAYLRFGFQGMGRLPVSGARFVTTYRVGNGSAGNVGPDAVNLIVSDVAPELVRRVSNLLPARGGTNAEPMEETRLHAPQVARSPARCVTPADYITMALDHPAVAQAAAEIRWTGSWFTAFLYVRRSGSALVDEAFRREVAAFMAPYLMTGYEIEVLPARYVPLAINLAVQIDAAHHRLTARERIMDRLTNGQQADEQPGFFHPSRFNFGQTLHQSELIAAIMALPGVRDVQVIRFGRQDGRPLVDPIPLAPTEVIEFSPAWLELTVEGGR